MIKELTRQEVADILTGATVFGAGGGGELAEGFGLIDAALAQGKSFRMIALDDVPDDAVLATPYLLGAISDLPEGTDALVGGVTHPSLLAAERLGTYLGRPLFGTIACELGGSNTAVPFFLAAMQDAVVVDADPAGRAVPEITHSAYFLAGLPASPIVAANARGETMILENIADDARAEIVMRALSQVSSNDIAAIDHALPAAALRGHLIPGTLTRAGRVGKLMREQAGTPQDLPALIAATTGGIVAFEGEVTSSVWRTEDGFTAGFFAMAGQGAFTDHRFKVDLKNENMIGWLDDAPFVTIPEIITVLDRTTGQVVTNPNVKEGQSLSVLVLPAPDIFLTRAGLKAFGPHYAGLDQPFSSALSAAP